MIGLALAPNLARSKAWWPEGAVYAADFVNRRYMKNGVHIPQSAAFTLTRASEKLAQTSSGEWVLFPPDVPAITDQGLFCEPEETFYPVNALFEGAMPGLLGAGGTLPTNWTVLVSGGLSIEVVHTGMHGDAPYVRLRIFGTTTGTDFQIALNAYTQAATAGETWTAALSLRHVAGETAGIVPYVRVVEEESGAYVDASTQMIDLSESFLRSSIMRTLTGGTATNVRARFRLSLPAPDVTMDIAVDFLMPTLANSGAIGTPMLTSSAGQIGRAADNAAILLPSSASDQLALQLADGSSDVYEVTDGAWPVPETLSAPILSAQLS